MPLPRLAACAFATALVACSGSGGTPDKDLSGLVVAATAIEPQLDTARAAKDPDALARSIAAPYRLVAAALGAHEVTATAKVEVREGTAVVESLTSQLSIDADKDGQYRAVLDNSADYGREVIFIHGKGTGGELYLRPRYGRWHRRAPNDDAEAAQIVGEMYGELAAQYELLARAVDVADKGAVQQSGRAARRISIALAKAPRKPLPQRVSQKKWRESAVVEAATGEVILDDKTGVPLRAHVTGQVAFARDGRRFTMTIEVTSNAVPLATPPTFVLPEAGDVVATPERLREVDERDFLLEGMAPRVRRKEAP